MGMTLARLKEVVDFSIEHERNPEEVEVVINVKLPYVTCGSRPGIGVKNASMGFDWEAGQFRITPDENLIAIKHDVPQPVIERNEYYHCPKCEHMLSKRQKTDIRFCSRCGQAVKWE